MTEVFIVTKKILGDLTKTLFIEENISVFTSKQQVEEFLDKLNLSHGNPTIRTQGYIFDFEIHELDKENETYEF